MLNVWIENTVVLKQTFAGEQRSIGWTFGQKIEINSWIISIIQRYFKLLSLTKKVIVWLGQTVFAQGAAATPIALLSAMTEVGKKKNLKNINVCHMHTEGPAAYTDPSCEGIFR